MDPTRPACPPTPVTTTSSSVVTPVIRTLADVTACLQADPTLPLARQREMLSALRITARLLELEPAMIAAEPRSLRRHLEGLSAAAAGVSPARWNNLRSLLLAALRQAGVRTLPGRAPTPLCPVWEGLRQRLPDAASRHGLSRFMSFCSAQPLRPEAVGTTTFAAFHSALDDDSLARTPSVIYRRSCVLWNTAARSISGWPGFTIAVPVNSRCYALAWEDFPASFQADADGFLHRLGNQDPFAEDYAVSVRPSTTAMRRKQILQIATALVRSGQPASAITGLATLVEVPNARRALRFFLDRAGGKPTTYLHQQALLLKTIARHWLKAASDHVAALAQICRRLAVKHTGMTEKNRTRLRQFDNPDNVRALINLAHHVLDPGPDKPAHLAKHGSLGKHDRARKDDGSRRVALRAMHALAVGVLVVAPIRADNLAGLRLDRHVVRVTAGRTQTLHLVIPAEETKNGAPYELEIPAETAKLLAIYLARYHARVSTVSSPWLFPNELGKRRSTVTFTKGICDFVRCETGIVMNLHLFRHAAVKVYLEAHPEDVETARRLLGHKSVTTTLRSYAETRTAAAFRRYDEVIQKLRDQPATPVRRRPGPTGERP